MAIMRWDRRLQPSRRDERHLDAHDEQRVSGRTDAGRVPLERDGMMDWVHRAALRPLQDLGDLTPAFRGVLSGRYDPEIVARFVHEQFRTGASDWAARFADTAHFTWLLRRAFASLPSVHTGAPLRILDLGSGSGNTIFPLLEICPEASIVATDISVEMLATLRNGLREDRDRQRCALLQMNAEEIEFAPATFDLVVGGAVLHHLFAPQRALAGVANVLKPGGAAVFFEPFEPGNMLLRLAYEGILAEAQEQRVQEPLRDDVRSLLARLIVDFDARKGTDKSDPRFATMDDKWLFTFSGIDTIARAQGFSRCRVESILAPEDPFERQTVTYLRVGIGGAPEALPEWAWRHIRHLDETFSREAKLDLAIEGIVVLDR